MKIRVCLPALITLAANCFASGQARKNQPDMGKSQAVAFVNVNVVPMDRERISLPEGISLTPSGINLLMR